MKIKFRGVYFSAILLKDNVSPLKHENYTTIFGFPKWKGKLIINLSIYLSVFLIAHFLLSALESGKVNWYLDMKHLPFHFLHPTNCGLRKHGTKILNQTTCGLHTFCFLPPTNCGLREVAWFIIFVMWSCNPQFVGCRLWKGLNKISIVCDPTSYNCGSRDGQ